MMERLIEQKSAINVFLAENDCDIELLTCTDFKLMENLIRLLEPLEIATTELSGDKYSSISLVIPILTQMHVTLKGMKFDDVYSRKIRDDLYASIKNRFNTIEKDKIYRNSKLLDPRIKDTCFILEENRINAKKELLEEVIVKAKQNSPSQKQLDKNIEAPLEPPAKKRRTIFDFIQDQQFDKPSNDIVNQCSVEIDSYFREAVLETKSGDSKNENILKWWQQNKFRFPNLYKLVKKYLCIPATSCSSERIFSKAGEILSKKRSRLSPKRVNQLIFLNHNLKKLCS